tara:strand:- start:3554 stop:4018 length:465 start_codon:yes stop_codon:yes gene_type:complete
MADIDLRKMKEEESQQERHELIPREMTFSIKYFSPDGEDRNISLRSKVMGGDDQIIKLRIQQSITRGLDFSRLPDTEQFRIEALSRCTVMLQDPEQWFLDSINEDNELLFETDRILREHEAFFFRGNDKKSGSAEGSKRMEITCSVLERARDTK